MRKCLYCGKALVTRFQIVYCTNKCQHNHQHTLFINEWKLGKKVVTKNISSHIKRYFIDTHGEECMLCGWNTKNALTDRVPLEIDHIDGDYTNNNENNLRLICPNCHSLTRNYKNLNKGKGRAWRRKI